MEAEDLKHLKEAVDMVEERLPAGKYLTRIVLALLLIMVGVWAFLYVWHNAVIPLARILTPFITWIFSKSVPTPHVTIFEVVTVVLALLSVGILSWLFSKIFGSFNAHVKGTTELANETLRLAENVEGTLDFVTALEKRVSALEDKKPPQISN